MKESLRAQALRLASHTANAYSVDSYTVPGWVACCSLLLKRGYSEIEAEAILRSKHMRWAGDQSRNRYGRYTSADLARYLATESGKSMTSGAELALLVAQTTS